MLKDTQLAPGFSMAGLAEITEGHSGSDLRELCRNAAMVPVREFMRSAEGNEELLAKGQLEVRFKFLFLTCHPLTRPYDYIGLQATAIGTRRLLRT